MMSIAIPVVFALFLWWASTGAILWLIRLPARTHKATAIGATGLLIAATAMIAFLREQTGVAAAYGAFALAILSWGWHEVMFLLGFISGPNKQPCPPDLDDWPRFVASARAVIYHEIAIALHAVLLVALVWDAANPIAAWTFLLLWAMRLSAKLIVFLGAPNISDSFLPAHLGYLTTYFAKGPISIFTPLPMAAVTIATAILLQEASAAPVGTFHSTGWVLVSALAVLALIEHLALLAPVPDQALWSWAVKPDNANTTNTGNTDGGGHGF